MVIGICGCVELVFASPFRCLRQVYNIYEKKCMTLYVVCVASMASMKLFLLDSIKIIRKNAWKTMSIHQKLHQKDWGLNECYFWHFDTLNDISQWYFGLGPIPKPKLTDDFGRYRNQYRKHISNGESSYRYWNNLALAWDIFFIIKGPLKPNLQPNFEYFLIIYEDVGLSSSL